MRSWPRPGSILWSTRQTTITPRRFIKTESRPMTTRQEISAQTHRSTTPPRSLRSILRLVAVSGIGFFVAGHIFFHYGYEGDFAYGISMLPTLSSFGNYVIIDKSYRRGRGVTVGDVVSFKHPVRLGEYACKRVMGLEGDFVLMYTPGANDAMLQIPKGHCWVVGDNLPHSRDSRTFGPLPMALISGKIIAKLDLETWSLFSPSSWFTSCNWIENGLQSPPEDDED